MAPSWQKRFDFFNAYGLPNSTPEAKAAYRALSFGARLQIGSNFLAFFFGPLYFIVKGMWRKGLTLLGIVVAATVILAVLNVPDGVARGAGIGLAAVAMSLANYAYYLHVAQGSRSWNLLEGFVNRKR
ncbi:DUF2628 domain-containing protein [Mycobacterium sp. CBMA247]|nr:DUF2628 domain-containing protein [Mycolicibacterium sp. CBMA 329]MUL91409.1 DUF2628 domain-containing protein [Mycolicibacterium sp. CBMA 331]MUM01532.1 DUF2628 domain-containing protein [Mycolicibacterium sp. CBMA 334]MUM29396.1 DUF2628 domain-containing protein [Mycolicibacterium sp. CBMA 295]MUM41833.1 DUF2628 domain-containing protein [Mycolicibacterium sp. CBMA 247]MUM47364.1 DUF2628 domain-containing protein [Mycolicibacterium sp. CBMA 294]